MDNSGENEKSLSNSPDPKNPRLGRRGFMIIFGAAVANAALLWRLPNRQSPTRTKNPNPSISITNTKPRPPETTFPTPSSSTEQIPDNYLYDTVISGGRVIDPETGFDSIAHVGIEGKSISKISFDPLVGRKTLEATGLIVSPGFIDILSYPVNGYGDWYKIADGVTSNLCMHGMDNPTDKFLSQAADLAPPVNYGGAVDHYEHRKRFKRKSDSSQVIGIQRSTPSERIELLRLAERDLEAGALGIHQQPEYTVDLELSEMISHGELATRYNVPMFLHVRFSENNQPGTQSEALNEALEVALATGCAVHIEHINSTGGTGRMKAAIAQLQTAKDKGVSVTACIYPYTYWATNAGTARFNNFQEKYGISYNDLQVLGTKERLNEKTWATARANNKTTAAYAMNEEDITDALTAPWVMVGSDAILESDHNNHPRSAGCFSRFIGKYARDKEVISLLDALSRITILPARLLGTASPSMNLRGRLQVGAIADITVFDPTQIVDRATVADPAQESVGVVHVMVGGQLVRSGGITDRTVRPGVPILRGV